MRTFLFILLVISNMTCLGIGAHASINVWSMSHLSKEKNFLTEMPESSQMSNDKNYVILRRNKSFAKQIANKTNTVFEIRYSFNLKNKTVNIPDNCVLKFKGGKIKNGVIIGNKTIVESDDYAIFRDVIIRGVWNNKSSYTGWLETTNHDKYNLIRSAFILGENVHFQPKKNFNVRIPLSASELINPANHTIIGNDATITVYGGHHQSNLFYVCEECNGFNIEVESLIIVGIGQYAVNKGDFWMTNSIPNAFQTSNVIGFHIVGRGNLAIKDCHFSNVLYGVRIDESKITTPERNFTMYSCTSDDKCIMPVMTHHVNNSIIKKCNLTCARSTGLIHHLYLADGIDSLIVEGCYLYGGTGDPLDIYHSQCKTQLIKNNTIQANDYSAIVLDDVDHDVYIEDCNLSATGRGCLYVYKCRGRVIGSNTTFKTPMIDEISGNYVIHSPYSEEIVRVQLDSCIINAYKLHSDVSSKLTLDIDNCQMRFNTGASISRPVSQVTYNIRNSHITCPNFTRYSTLFDIRSAESVVNLTNTEIDRGEAVGDWLISVDVPYKLNVKDCVCTNVKSIVNKKVVGAKTSTINSKIVTKRVIE